MAGAFITMCFYKLDADELAATEAATAPMVDPAGAPV
jgi:GPH family glycoside/pentoside/hexuronide:cation symporter